MRLSAYLEKQGKWFWGAVGLAFVVFLGLADYFTGFELNISFFYLIPIGLLAWYAGGQLGLLAAALSAVVNFLADYSTGLVYSHPSTYVVNATLRLSVFSVISGLVSSLRRIYKTNQELLRVDFVSGAASIRYFYELAKAEIIRSERYQHPFTFAYIDMDNFKDINDRLGHSTGDQVLRVVTETVQKQIRASDSLGRLGGDEFGLLLPETEAEDAKQVVTRIHASMVKEMLKNRWTATFSMGVVTFRKPPHSVDEMVHLADAAMYAVKGSGKNGVNYRVYDS